MSVLWGSSGMKIVVVENVPQDESCDHCVDICLKDKYFWKNLYVWIIVFPVGLKHRMAVGHNANHQVTVKSSLPQNDFPHNVLKVENVYKYWWKASELFPWAKKKKDMRRVLQNDLCLQLNQGKAPHLLLFIYSLWSWSSHLRTKDTQVDFFTIALNVF